jgi:hypothetical protein
MVPRPVLLAAGALARAAAVLTVLALTRATTSPLMHVALVLMVVTLTGVGWAGHLPGSPVSPAPGAVPLLVRSVGLLLVAVATLGTVLDFRSAGHVVDKAATGVPVLTLMLSLSVVGVLALTGRVSRASRRDLSVGVAGGVLAAVVWAVPLLLGPVPGSILWALVVMTAAGGGLLVPDAQLPGRLGRAACAVLVASLLVVATVQGLQRFGPARFVPDLTPAAPPADRISESRIEMADPYLGLLLLGCLLGAALTVTAFRAASRPEPVGA